MPEIAFVVGATGYTGRHVVQQLAALAIPTVAHIRPGSPHATAIQGLLALPGVLSDETPWNSTALSQSLRNHAPTLLFSLIGLSKIRHSRQQKQLGPAYTDTFISIDEHLVGLLIDATIQSGQRPRFVFLSALGTHRLAPGEYYQTRWRIEEKLRNCGLPYTIFRSGLISGPDRDPDRRIEYDLARVSNFFLEPLRRAGFQKIWRTLHSISGDDLAKELVGMALDPTCENRILEPRDLVMTHSHQ